MPVYSEKKELPYTQKQLFELVADVEKYHEFLPWCIKSIVTKREGNVFYADLTIGYKMIQETFTSKVILHEPKRIDVEYLNGPMKSLSNRWGFIEQENGSCEIDFYVDFEFKSLLLRRISNMFFNEIIRKMVHSFENRAKSVYSSCSQN